MIRIRILGFIATTFLCVVAYSLTKINYWYLVNYLLYRPMVKVEEVYFPEADKKLYMKSYQKGLNHEVKVISTSACKFSNPDVKVDFVLGTQLDIFYERIHDILRVYLLSNFQVSRTLPKGLFIQQILLDNPSYMNLYDDSRNKPSQINSF